MLLLTPGPAVLYIITRSVAQGRRAGLVSVCGIEAGTSVHVAAATLGVSTLLMSSAMVFAIVKYLGAGYLIYLGVRTLRSPAPIHVQAHGAPQRLRRVFGQGVVVATLNPKTALFFAAFLPQFVDPSRGAIAMQMLALGGIFMGLAAISDSLYALVAGTAGDWLQTSRVVVQTARYLPGIMYIGLGITAALADVRRH